MTDLSQPATAAEFQAAGVDAATAANLAMQANMMAGRAGTPEQRAEIMTAVRDRAPLPKPTAPASATTPEETLEALSAHQEAEQAPHLDAIYSPPAQASDYQFPYSLDPQTDDAIKADGEFKAALHAEGLPRHIVEGIGKELAEAASTRPDETPEQAGERQASVRATLEKWYGDQTDSNVRMVDRLIDRLLRRGGATADFIAAAAPHLSALDIDSLVQFVKHREGGR